MSDAERGAARGLAERRKRGPEAQPADADWLSWGARDGAHAPRLMAAVQGNWRAWHGISQFWLAALRAGGVNLWREAERQRQRMFSAPRVLSRFVAVGYASSPSSLHEELAWLRSIGVRDVVLPIDQDGSEACREKALTAVRNLRSEDCRIGAVLREKMGAEAHPEAWREFCQGVLVQTGWFLERAQIGSRLDERAGDKLLGRDVRQLFDLIPRLRIEYPGVAFLPPDISSIRPAAIRALRCLLPPDGRWDGLSVRLPADSSHNASGRAFLLHVALIGAVAARAEEFGGKLQLCFAAAPLRNGDVQEAIMGGIVKRIVLAMAAGVAERVVIEVDPIQNQLRGATLTRVLHELVSHLEGARFIRRRHVGDPGRDFVMEFHRPGTGALLVAWTEDGARPVRAGFHVREARDFLGRTVPLIPFPRLRLTETVSFFSGD